MESKLYKKIKEKPLILGAVTASTGGLVAKILGAVYRVPLFNIIGSRGMGLYQMVFPLYTVLLTFSSTGLPSSLSKIISEENNADYILNKAKKVFGVIGVIGSITMFILSYYIAKLQGEIKVATLYMALSPSVYIVSIISAYRGYFQGLNNMRPTAVSQVLEQTVKIAFGLSLAWVFRKFEVLSVLFCVVSVTLSEIIALIFLVKKYKKRPNNTTINTETNISTGKLILTVLPITLTAVLIPLSRVIDSFLVVNIISRYRQDATNLYGLYSGGVESIVGVPVAMCYGIAMATIPIVSSAKKESKNIKDALILTLILSVLLSMSVIIFSKIAVNTLYFTLNYEYKYTMIKLLKLSSIVIVLLSVLQTSNAILIAENKLYVPTVALSFGIIVKTFLLIVLLPIKSVNIYSILISDILCYFVACFINLVYYITINKRSGESFNDNTFGVGYAKGRLNVKAVRED